jgi:hypothetical protein
MSRSTLSTLLLLVLALLWAAPRSVHAAESYSNCKGFITSLPTVIGTPGTWCFNQNLSTSVTSGNAITVNANSVTIDCNDFKLDGLGGGAATNTYGIVDSSFARTTIRHCNLRGFIRGVFLTGTGGGHLIEDNRFDGITYNAIGTQGNGTVIRRNRIFDTGGATSFANAPATPIATDDSVDIIDNTIVGVAATSPGTGGSYGIDTEFNPDGSVTGNRVAGLVKASAGFVVGFTDNGSDRIILRDNELVGDSSNFSVGMDCDVSNSRARDNLISGFATGITGCANDPGNVIKP